jgi:periplasmic protein TonB
MSVESTASLYLASKPYGGSMRLDIFLPVALMHALLLGFLLHQSTSYTPPQVLHASWLGNSGAQGFGAGNPEAQTKQHEVSPRKKTSPLTQNETESASQEKNATPSPSVSTQPEKSVLTTSDNAASQNDARAHKESAPDTTSSSGESGKLGEAAEFSGRGTTYLHNPDPNYPQESVDFGEEGKVLLRVHISIQGLPEAIEIYRTSGYSRLDHAAKSGVERWRFRPAHQDNTPIAVWVIIPVKFTLRSS